MRSAFPPKYAATFLILLTLLTNWAGVVGFQHSTTVASRIGAFIPAAICLGMTIRVTREYYRMQ